MYKGLLFSPTLKRRSEGVQGRAGGGGGGGSLRKKKKLSTDLPTAAGQSRSPTVGSLDHRTKPSEHPPEKNDR